MPYDWTLLIVRASCWLFVSSFCVILLTRWRPLLNPRWHRFAWGIVLLQGVTLFPFSWNVNLPAWMSEPFQNEPLTANPSAQGLPRIRHFEVQLPANPDLAEFMARDESPVPAPQAMAQASVTPSAVADTTTSTTTDADRHVPSELPLVDEPTAPNRPQLESETRSSNTRRQSTTGMSRLLSALPDVPLIRVLMAIWALGVVAVTGTLVRHYALLNRALTQSRPARRSWAQELQSLCVELGLNHEVHLDVHPQLGPFVCWTPRGHRVVVPVRLWNRLSSDERVAVLHHELCHLRRGDLWKAGLARVVVALHWFNPLAWVSARRFDESAEWSCDAQLAAEAPARVTQLANALLAAAQSGQDSPMLALSATGGPLFQRVRRLVAWNNQGDTFMQKCLWIGLLAAVTCVGSVRFQFAAVALAADDPSPVADATVPDATAPPKPETPVTVVEQPKTPLEEIASRIVVGDNETLKKFVALIQTPTGQIVMADRAAVHAQNASNNADPASQWEQFLANHFDRSGEAWSLKPERGPSISEYVQAVEAGIGDEEAIAAVFQEVAQALDGKSDVAPVLKRFLQHEAAPAFVYRSELRSRLHPGINELAQRFEEHLVRTQSGSYVIRPARRQQVERRLAFIDQLNAPLGRFEKELTAWADDLVKGDALHDAFAKTLAQPEFAKYVVFSYLSEETRLDDEELDNVFGQLEEATTDTATGLKLNPESDQYKELQEMMQRFSVVWESRESLAEPLHRLADRIDEQDELHRRLKAFLKTDLALMFVAREMDYLPVPADAAAREWIAQIVTRNDAGQYEITVESTDDLKNRVEEFFREFRDIRRRGRVIDEAAAQLADSKTMAAMQSLTGKLLLAELVEQSAERPEVDGLQLWFGEYFEETPDGLVLHDWAGDVLNEVIAEAAEVEKELSKIDF